MAATVRTVLRAPFTARAWADVLFAVTGLPFGLPNPVVAFAAVIWLAELVSVLVTGSVRLAGNPSPPVVLLAVLAALLLLPVLVATGAARRLGAGQRRLAARFLGEQVAAPPPRPNRPGGLRGSLRDGPGWRAAGYLLVKLPVALLELFALGVFWAAGLVNMTYPFWWLSFRNHGQGVHLSPVPVVTPFDWFGQHHFQIATFPGTFAAPWVTGAVVSADRWLIRGLLGPGRLAQRVADLEHSRALAVDDSAALLRRLERNLHDGAQIRLATLAMNLGMAKEKLGDDGEVPDAAAVRELVDAAHRGAKDALIELRGLARGIHPPALDNGLADALATLAADSAIPVELTIAVPVRPAPAIETIAYFCAAELLANAAKHSAASTITIRATGREDVLLLQVSDDGVGGADPARGSGLAGLGQRAAVVDGRLDITSPPGGPTRITVELPLRT
jgi:signal transduction histidine kinase